MQVSRMITAVDAHAGGEPGRVITGGVGPIPGDTVLDQQQYLATHRDDLRRLMLREPRGYPGLCCNLIVPPCHPEADLGFIVMEQMEYAMMSGSNTMCTVTVALETGIIAMVEPVTELVLEAPAGLVRVRATCTDGKVQQVTFTNVPAFVLDLDVPIEVSELGTVTVDLAWGGMMFVLFDAAQVGLGLTPDQGGECVRIGSMVKAATLEQHPVVHPENDLMTGPTITCITSAAHDVHEAASSGRNATVISTGAFDWDDRTTWTAALDRSACGTATCARMATLHARGRLGLGDDYVHESILGTTFTGRLLEETSVAGRAAVVPQISGQAWITGIAQYVVDPTDPFPEGFTVGDIWGGMSDD